MFIRRVINAALGLWIKGDFLTGEAEDTNSLIFSACSFISWWAGGGNNNYPKPTSPNVDNNSTQAAVIWGCSSVEESDSCLPVRSIQFERNWKIDSFATFILIHCPQSPCYWFIPPQTECPVPDLFGPSHFQLVFQQLKGALIRPKRSKIPTGIPLNI